MAAARRTCLGAGPLDRAAGYYTATPRVAFRIRASPGKLGHSLAARCQPKAAFFGFCKMKSPIPPALPSDPPAARPPAPGPGEQRPPGPDGLPPDASPEVQCLVQKLQAHQLELEMQYQELLAVQADAERSRLQYIDLYNFAPVGYCTLSPNGNLLQFNERTEHLLGQPYDYLQGRQLAHFVVPAERAQLTEFLARLWAAPGQRQSCELALAGPGGQPLFVQLEGSATPEDEASQPPTSCRLVLLDVTARRRATDALAASEARFRATFEQARDGMILLEDHRLADINAAGLHLLGVVDERRVLGLPLETFWPEFQPDGRRSVEVLADCLATARTRGWCRLEWRRYSPAGEEIWDEMSFNPVVVNGQPLLHASWRDVTARKHNEQQLRESERYLDLALAATSTGVWTWEPATDLLYQDARAQEILSLSPDTQPAPVVPFETLRQALDPADATRLAGALAKALREHSVLDLEHRLVHADGSVRYVAAMGRFTYDERTGQPLRFAGLVRDVTPRRQAEETLNYKNRLLDNLLKHLPVLLARLGPDGRYREHVGQTLARLGLAENELVGRLAVEVFPTSAPRLQRILAGERISYVSSFERNGQPFRLQCFGFFDEQQQEGVFFALDVTEPELLKEEAANLRQRQQHELLSAILSTQEEERRRIAEALHNGVGQLLYGTRLHLDALPRSEAVRASQQLLNEAIEATRSISFELTPTILEDFGLEVALQELVSRIPARLPVDLNLNGLAEPLPALLSMAVYRIVQELLNNVMKHAQAHEVFVQVSREGDQLYLSVEDDGQGFEVAAASRSGIGLAGIRTRVGMLGGTLDIQSRAGRGTGVFLQLPIAVA